MFPIFLALASGFLPGVIGDLQAQEPEALRVDATTEARIERELRDIQRAIPGHQWDEPWKMPVEELELELQPLRMSVVQSRVSAWVDILKQHAEQRNATQRVIEKEKRAAEEGGSLDEAYIQALMVRQDGAQERVNRLVERLNVAVDQLEKRGGDVAAERAYIDVVATLRQRLAQEEALKAEARRNAQDAMTEAEKEAAERAVLMASAVESIRRDPPVHERPEPWKISRRELDLELQPLPVAKIKERAEIWSQMLELRVRERNRLLLAVDRPENEAISGALATRATEAEATVQAIVDRMNVMLTMLENRGEDTAALKKYISDVTGIKLNVTNVTVLAKQVWAWVISEAGGVRWGLKILAFLGTLFAAWLLGRIISAILNVAMVRIGNGSAILRETVTGIVRKVIVLIGFVVALSVLGVNITPLVAAIGAAGLVIGLALQGTLSNFASGILILINKPFELGDAINAGGVTGKVDGLTLVNTRIMTFDNQVMYVPNNQIWGDVITNLTGNATRRVDLMFGIGYNDDMTKAETIIYDVISKHPKTLDDPAPTIKVHELGDNSVNFVARPWAKTGDYWDVYWDVTRQVKERFDAEGVGIPFPQRDLHVPGQIEVVLGDRRNKASSRTVPRRAAPSVQQANEKPVNTGGGTGEPGPADDDEAQTD